jgi:hypothetical protein
MFDSLDDLAPGTRGPARYTYQMRSDRPETLGSEPRQDGGLDALYQATHLEQDGNRCLELGVYLVYEVTRDTDLEG